MFLLSWIRQDNFYRRALMSIGLLVAGGVLTANVSTAAADLSSYRTVTNAQTTNLSNTNILAASHAGYLGVQVAPDKRGRVAIEDLDPDSPAARSDLQPGDILTRIDGRGVKTPDEWRDLIRTRLPDDTVKLTVERNRKTLVITITLGATSHPLKLSAQRTTLGVRLDAPRSGGGAEIQSISVGSPADRAGLRPGDLLIKLDGDIIPAPGFVRDRLDEKQPGETVRLTLFRNGEPRDIEAVLAAAASSPDLIRRNLWKKDSFRLAVIPVEFADVKHNAEVSSNGWSEFFFSTGVYSGRTNATGQEIFGSMADYYREVSCGEFRLEGKVLPWVEVPGKRAVYVQGTNAGNKAVFFNDVLETLLKRDGPDALKDFDGIHFLHAGDRFPTGDRGSLYWPHASVLTHQRKSWPYFICPEGGRRMADISTFCHEFGHILGLPDLYARPENPGSEGLGVWCLMSNENGGGKPQHFSAWCKEQLGWIKPCLIDPSVKQKLLLGPVELSSRECFKILARADGSEYFLLENRRRTHFDRALPGEGLLVWRVVNGKPILEESHGVEGPAGPRVFPSSVPYPSRANHAFTPFTAPSSRSLLGGGWPVHLTDIRQLEDGRIAFQIGYDYQ